MLLEQWGSWRHGSGLQLLHFLARATSRGQLQSFGGLEAMGGAECMVTLLLKNGCQLDAVGANYSGESACGATALHLLAKLHSRKLSREAVDDILALADALLKNGSRVDPQLPDSGRTPLTIAASYGQEELVRLLVRYGARPLAPDGDETTPIEYCRFFGEDRMARVLAELGSERGARGARRKGRRKDRRR